MIGTDRYKLYQGDCLEVMNTLIKEGVKVDAIITDPPYGISWFKWDNIIDFNLMWNITSQIIKKNGAIILFSTQPYTTKLINSNISNYKYTWYWIKNTKGNYLNAKRQPLRQLEEINVFNKHKYYPQGIEYCNKLSKRGSSAKTTMQNYKNEWIQQVTNYPTNVLYYSLDNDKYHPCQKPVALLEYLIRTYTNEDDLILDFTCGSGSTGVACLNTNRRFIGIELDEKYFNIAQKRLKGEL